MRDSYGKGGRGGRNFGRRDNFDRPEMYDAICDNCGSECKVPFRPSGDKPIYCSKCFEKVDPRRDERSSREDRFPRRDNRDRFSDNDRSRRRESSRPTNSNAELSQLKDQLGSISAKLDKLVRLLTPVVVEETNSDFNPIREVKSIRDYVTTEEKAPKKEKKKVSVKKKAVKKVSKKKE